MFLAAVLCFDINAMLPEEQSKYFISGCIRCISNDREIFCFLVCCVRAWCAVISGEKQLKEFTKFLQSHDTLLARLIYQTNSINAVTAATSTDSNVNRSEIDAIPPQSMALSAKRKFIAAGQQCRPIGVDFGTGWESVATVDLIRSDNKCLNKMIIVFVQLCMEVRELIAEGNTLLTNCLFADEDLFVMQTDDDAHSAAAQQNDGCDSSSDRLDDGPLTADALCKISDILDLLCRTEHFVERCYVVIAEIIKQFSALFAPENKYYINVNSSSLHFQVSSVRFDHRVTANIENSFIFLNADGVQLFGRGIRADHQIRQCFEKWPIAFAVAALCESHCIGRTQFTQIQRRTEIQSRRNRRIEQCDTEDRLSIFR